MASVFIIFFFLWKLIDRFIDSLAGQDDTIAEEGEEDADSEWGGGQLLDRSQTLLPIVRKFLGIVIFVMLVLFSLSSLGVNIGPLLAGAGVMGIAIGFGAGGESRQPLGLATVGGLVFSQFLTLYITPVVYTYLDRFQKQVSRKVSIFRTKTSEAA